MKSLIKYLVLIISIIGIRTINPQPTVEWIETYHGPANGGIAFYTISDNENNIYVCGKNIGMANNYDIVTIK